MASELMERLIIPYLDEASAKYSVLREDVVVVELPVEAAGTINVLISDQEESWEAGLLCAVAPGIVKFPESRTRRALDLCNALNQHPIGKFIVGDDGNVSYWLDWVVVDRAEPKNVRLMLSLVAATIEARYSTIMAARWGNAEV